jgi:hypothetical protein
MNAHQSEAAAIADARASLIAEWDDNASHYPYVTAGMVWEVSHYALAADVALPADENDKDAVRAFVDAARTA